MRVLNYLNRDCTSPRLLSLATFAATIPGFELSRIFTLAISVPSSGQGTFTAMRKLHQAWASTSACQWNE